MVNAPAANANRDSRAWLQPRVETGGGELRTHFCAKIGNPGGRELLANEQQAG